MECPTPCDKCGEIVELDSMAFFTAYCECERFGPTASCTHGLCKMCKRQLDDELFDEDE